MFSLEILFILRPRRYTPEKKIKQTALYVYINVLKFGYSTFFKAILKIEPTEYKKVLA